MTLEPYTITLEDAPSDQDLEAVQSGLNAHNAARSGRESRQRLSAFLRDAGGQVAGGAIGWTWGEVADIRVLWVRDDVRGRGYGRQLMQTVEYVTFPGLSHAHIDLRRR